MTERQPSTLLDKLWMPHVVAELGDGIDLLHVDRHFVHDLAGVISWEDMAVRGIATSHPEMTIGMLDHAIPSDPMRNDQQTAVSRRYLPTMRALAAKAGVSLIDIDDPRQGIVHVAGPELGLSLPGMTIVCGDSHTCTHGALGALAWGIGSSEVTHVLATQSIRQRRPKAYRIRLTGRQGACVDAKDIILYCIGMLGTAFGTGAAIEFAGPVVEAMPMEQRFILCNMTVELGAKFGLIAPDDKTFDYVSQTAGAPRADMLEAALAHWRTLYSDADAEFSLDLDIDCDRIVPQITWGTTPEQVSSIMGIVPQPEGARAQAWQAAQHYMGLKGGAPLIGTPVDYVFIGSCAGGRLSDLRAAAAVLHGKRVADGVEMWVVPGSTQVKQQAQAEGLDQIFMDAGARWRASGCSMCVGSNGDTIPPGKRCVSTSNRNFVGRQGQGARTHLASALTAAACALTGTVVDPRTVGVQAHAAV